MPLRTACSLNLFVVYFRNFSFNVFGLWLTVGSEKHGKWNWMQSGFCIVHLFVFWLCGPHLHVRLPEVRDFVHCCILSILDTAWHVVGTPWRFTEWLLMLKKTLRSNVSRVTSFSTPRPLGVKKKKKGICLSISWKLPESSVNSSLSIWQKDCVLRRLFKAQACLCNWGVWPGFPWVT